MPHSTLSLARIQALLASPLADDALDAALFASKAELEGRQGDALDVSVTPDRLDLLSEGGLALYLEGVTGQATGAPKLRRARKREEGLRIVRDRSVLPLRPHIAGVVVRAPPKAPLDDGLLAEAVRFQELLHATIGRDRRAMSLGIYPAKKLLGPIRYALEPTEAVSFVPLHATTPVSAPTFLGSDPMAARYGALGRSDRACLTLRDARGEVLSLPPVLNSATAGEARAGDRVLLLEATGTRERAVRDGLGLLLVVFASRGWSVEAVPVLEEEKVVDDGSALLAPNPVELTASTLRSIAGVTWEAREVNERLARARLAAKRIAGGWAVRPPPWRPDLLTGTDVAEDVVLARELKAEDGVVPPASTRGRRRPESRFRRRIGLLLVGSGFQQPHTPILVSEAVVAKLGGPAPLKLSNPVSAELAFVRDRLLLSHLGVLERNRRHGYPQRFAEVGPVVVRDPAAEAGASTRYHASLVLAGESSGFADVAAMVDYLLRTLDVGSVREPAELAGTIAGRAARVRVAGETVAEFGELDPSLLEGLGVPVPVAWAELDLSALWPLAGGRDRA
jgi:phenylalanyl-tRNA synthetase beta chain